MSQPLLQVNHLKTQFRTKRNTVVVVDDVSFAVHEGETLGIVGESGCGKSVTSLSILRLLPHAVGSIAGGEILYKGEDLTQKCNEEMCRIRGEEIAMIFQDSMTSLNPVLSIGKQLEETISAHNKLPREIIKKRALELLTKVGISSPEQRLQEYPHQLSGGMRQRVMIAMALSCNPSLLIADEPTTALDVTIQAQIIDLMVELKRKLNTAIILITHDMGVVAKMADNIMVMYAGKVMEYGTARQIFKNPLHPYTQGLLASMPRLDKDCDRLATIEGTVPTPAMMPKGCRFCARCTQAMTVCQDNPPPIYLMMGGQKVQCWKYKDQAEGEEA
ncbi:MAG TPA: ABC transporter ATP-binding protein [Negativicutes bacterium]|nr:ABC transporter ATP-binding protein [Negativicutes bacterium]